MYRVGDKVRIRKDLVLGRRYVSACVAHKMALYRGETTSIKRVHDGCYDLVVDNGEWDWTDEMLEPVGKPTIKRPHKFLVVWEEDSDHCEFFETKPQAMKKVRELMDNSSVQKNSIKLIKIKNMWQAEQSFSIKLKKERLDDK